MGESFYNFMLPDIVKDLMEQGFAKEDQGAICIFVPKIKQPLIIRKSDGGYNYDTTDMAALKYRLTEFQADRIIITTDDGQWPHFKLIFEAGAICGYYDKEKVRLDHMGFGLVLQKIIKTPEEEAKEAEEEAKRQEEEEKKEGEKKEEESKGKPKKQKQVKNVAKKISTREGNSVKLIELLNEGRERALETFRQRIKEDSSVNLSEQEQHIAAEILGISAIKYFEYNRDRKTQYIFDFDAVLDPRGNTGVYLIYQYVRICSMMRKANTSPEEISEKVKNGL